MSISLTIQPGFWVRRGAKRQAAVEAGKAATSLVVDPHHQPELAARGRGGVLKVSRAIHPGRHALRLAKPGRLAAPNAGGRYRLRASTRRLRGCTARQAAHQARREQRQRPAAQPPDSRRPAARGWGCGARGRWPSAVPGPGGYRARPGGWARRRRRTRPRWAARREASASRPSPGWR